MSSRTANTDTLRFDIPTPVLRWPECERLGEPQVLLARQSGARRLILSFDRVTMVTAAALGKLIVLRSKLTALGTRLVLHGIRPEVHEVFEATSLDRLFDIRH